MAYIAPNTEIRLLKNVPLSKDYENTILFSTAAAQAAYFMGKTAHTLDAQSYQRVTPNYIMLEVRYDQAVKCNYIMYRNTSYYNKWFYAFIDQVEYVNNKTSKITFSLDLLQTWHFDYELTDCFIERNHTAVDTIKSSLTAEPVQIGEYVDNSVDKYLNDDFKIIVATVDVDQQDRQGYNVPIVDVMDPSNVTYSQRATRGHVYQQIYSGLTLVAFNANDTSNIDGYIGKIIQDGRAESIVNIYMIPGDAFTFAIPDSGFYLPDGEVTTGRDRQIAGINSIGQNPDSLNGYVPKNKKLYTYPYNYLELSNGSGGNIALRYEMFSDPTLLDFSCKFNIQPPVSAVIAPKNYNGLFESQTGIINNDYQLALADYPVCSWNVDTYSAWSAQNSINMASNLIGGTGASAILNATQGGALAGVATAVTGGIGYLINQALQAHRAMRAADTVHGSTQTGNGAIAQKRQNIFIKRKSMQAQFAKIADDYFTMYGYSVNNICDVSNDDPRDHRPHFTYIKTIGCDISGELPAEDMRQINKLYDGGIRFWKNPAEIGDYSVDNAPAPTP